MATGAAETVADELRKADEVELRGTALARRAPARRLRAVDLSKR